MGKTTALFGVKPTPNHDQRHVPVRVGIRVDDDAEILRGIAVGDWVVAGDAVVRLADGTRVRGLGATTAAANPAGEKPGT